MYVLNGSSLFGLQLADICCDVETVIDVKRVQSCRCGYSCADTTCEIAFVSLLSLINVDALPFMS